MPELPEVETVVQGLLLHGIVGKKIVDVTITYPKLVESDGHFIKQVTGATIRRCYRRAKFIVLELDTGKALLIHLRMTGKLLFSNKDVPHQHAHFMFKDGTRLCYSDVRKFGRFALVDNAESHFATLGLEMLAADFSLAEFSKRIQGSKRALKALLLDQKVIAGLGNIYADEALFCARLHPQKKAHILTKSQIKTLASSIQSILKAAIKKGGSSLGKGLGNFLNAYGQAGENQNEFFAYQRTKLPCYLCATPIQRIVMGQRSTHFCPSCQQQ